MQSTAIDIQIWFPPLGNVVSCHLCIRVSTLTLGTFSNNRWRGASAPSENTIYARLHLYYSIPNPYQLGQMKQNEFHDEI